jgi:hypothetical protein
MLRCVFPFLIAAQLCACAPQAKWHKEGATEQDFATDSYECERDARQSGYYGTGLVGVVNMRGFYRRCMGARGYYLAAEDDAPAPNTASDAATPSDPQAAAAARLAAGDRCEAKGFHPPSKAYGECFAAEFSGSK